MLFGQALKPIFRFFLKYYLKLITITALFVHDPVVIAVAGSANKTFVKDEIVRVLREKGNAVRANPKSFNTEIGLPLAILDLPSGYDSYGKWLAVIRGAYRQIWQSGFPRFLVLELGVDKPGDMKYLLSLIRPKIAVVTDISQRYLESFADMDKLAGEYEYLARRLDAGGLLVLNADNPRVAALGRETEAETLSYGFGEKADWRAVASEPETAGQAVRVKHGGDASEHRLNRFGNHHVYALLIGLIAKNYAGKRVQ